MSHLDTKTIDRLNEAFTITMTADAVAMHEATIAEAIRTPHPANVQHRGVGWRLRVPAFLAAVAVIVPIGTAVAAESALPGDFLYPVKRITEPIISVFDPDVVATRRIDELSRIVDSPDDVDRVPRAVADAEDAVIDLPRGHHLRDDLLAITDRITNPPLGTRSDVPFDRPPSDKTPSDTEGDRPLDPVGDVGSKPRESDTPPSDDPTTTVPHRRESSDPRSDAPEDPEDSPP